MSIRHNTKGENKESDKSLLITEETIQLTIVTNSSLLADGLVSLLNKYIKVTLVAVYNINSACNFETPLPNPDGHVILIDGNTPTDMLINTIENCREEFTPHPVVVIDLKSDVSLIIACIEAGTRGYTLSGTSVEDVADLLVSAQRGEATCSPQMITQVFERLVHLSQQAPTIPPGLTPRQMEVLECITQGKSNKEIAEQLVIEVRTVKHHVHHILRKLNVRRRWDAAHLANEHGWLDVS